MKTVFAPHGMPEVLVADNMPHASQEMQDFANKWHVTITTSKYQLSHVQPKQREKREQSQACQRHHEEGSRRHLTGSQDHNLELPERAGVRPAILYRTDVDGTTASRQIAFCKQAGETITTKQYACNQETAAETEALLRPYSHDLGKVHTRRQRCCTEWQALDSIKSKPHTPFTAFFCTGHWEKVKFPSP